MIYLRCTRVALGALCLFSIGPAASGQGPLAPPGAPAPAMKSLDQVEARTIVNATNTPGNGGAAFVISQSGSYYLTGNITVASGDAIDITASGVTLDLNGFTISSTSSSYDGTGIYGSGSNLTICHGHITGTTTYISGTFSGGGFLIGVNIDSTVGTCRVEEITVSGTNAGITLYSIAGIISHCMVDTTRVDGIAGSFAPASAVDHCTASNCGGTAISSGVVDNCAGTCVGGSDGIDAESVSNSIGTSSARYGLSGVNATIDLQENKDGPSKPTF